MATAESTARRKASERASKRARRKLRALKGIWPARDRLYLDWLATLECIQPKCYCKNPLGSEQGLSLYMRKVEAAHTGPHGIAQKAPDGDAIPLCRWAHQEAKDAQGKSRTWFADHGLDRDAVLAEFRKRYEQECA